MQNTGTPFVVQASLFYTGYGMLSIGQILYRQYLKSRHWWDLRRQAFKKYGYQCNRCPARHKLQPHHHTYRHPWELCTVDDLEILCRNCHRAEHGLPPIVPKPRKPWKRKPRKAKKHSLVQGHWKNKVYTYSKYKPHKWKNRGTSSN